MNKKNVIANQHTYFACAMYKKKNGRRKIISSCLNLRSLLLVKVRPNRKLGTLANRNDFFLNGHRVLSFLPRKRIWNIGLWGGKSSKSQNLQTGSGYRIDGYYYESRFVNTLLKKLQSSRRSMSFSVLKKKIKNK